MAQLATAIGLLVRLAAWALGAFALLTGFIDLLGFMPHSEQIPPLSTRIASRLPSMLGGAVLLVPMTRSLLGIRYYFLAFSYGMLVVVTSLLAVRSVVQYVEGWKHWGIIPASLMFVAVPLSNGLLLWWLHRKATRAPNPSFKPNPLRGAA